MSTAWHVRPEGSLTTSAVVSPADVVAGLRDGLLLPTDEVKGPTDADWVTIESHPAFEEAAAELAEMAGAEPHEDTHLDMNPLIDVCLVLLIFFILTITYSSLRYGVDIPQEQKENKGSPLPRVEMKDIKDKVFRVSASMAGDNVVVKVEGTEVKSDPESLKAEMQRVIANTGRREMILQVSGDVPWGIQIRLLDAAKGAKVQNILYSPQR